MALHGVVISIASKTIRIARCPLGKSSKPYGEKVKLKLPDLTRAFAELDNAIYWIKYGVAHELERHRRVDSNDSIHSYASDADVFSDESRTVIMSKEDCENR